MSQNLNASIPKLARWCNGYSVGLAINRSRVQILLEATPRNNLGQVFNYGGIDGSTENARHETTAQSKMQGGNCEKGNNGTKMHG